MSNRSSIVNRRHLLQAAALTSAGSIVGASSTAISGDTPWVMRRAVTGDLVVGYAEAGPPDGAPVVLLHGWPYDIHAFVDVAPILATAGFRVLIPYLRGFGTTAFRSTTIARNGQQAALAADVLAFMDALRIDRAAIAGFDWGARSACAVAALWPDRCRALVAVSGYLISSQQASRAPLEPAAELSWWYQFYFATDRGRAGYEANREAFAKLIWRTASPQWAFGDNTFERSAAALGNPDHVAITVDNYRWRLGLVRGETRFDEIEAALAKRPTISVPTITLEGDANAAPHPIPASYAELFKGPYAHRLITRGVGHNLPQEAPSDFAKAVIDSTRL